MYGKEPWNKEPLSYQTHFFSPLALHQIRVPLYVAHCLPAWEHFRKHKNLLSKLFSFPPTPPYRNGWQFAFLMSKYQRMVKLVPAPMSFSKWQTWVDATLVSIVMGSETKHCPNHYSVICSSHKWLLHVVTISVKLKQAVFFPCTWFHWINVLSL